MTYVSLICAASGRETATRSRAMKMYLEVFMMKPFRVPAIEQNDERGVVIPHGVRISAMQDEIEKTFQVSAELKAVLLESIAQCERGDTISAAELFQEMLRESAARV